MKYRIILNGIVQGVGCRSLVKAAAKKFHLGGVVRNTDNGCVEIYTESNSDMIIENFVKEIKQAAKNTMIDIMKVSIYTENQNEYASGETRPPKDFSSFVVEPEF